MSHRGSTGDDEYRRLTEDRSRNRRYDTTSRSSRDAPSRDEGRGGVGRRDDQGGRPQLGYRGRDWDAISSRASQLPESYGGGDRQEDSDASGEEEEEVEEVVVRAPTVRGRGHMMPSAGILSNEGGAANRGGAASTLAVNFRVVKKMPSNIAPGNHSTARSTYSLAEHRSELDSRNKAMSRAGTATETREVIEARVVALGCGVDSNLAGRLGTTTLLHVAAQKGSDDSYKALEDPIVLAACVDAYGFASYGGAYMASVTTQADTPIADQCKIVVHTKAVGLTAFVSALRRASDSQGNISVSTEVLTVCALITEHAVAHNIQSDFVLVDLTGNLRDMLTLTDRENARVKAFLELRAKFSDTGVLHAVKIAYCQTGHHVGQGNQHDERVKRSLAAAVQALGVGTYAPSESDLRVLWAHAHHVDTARWAVSVGWEISAPYYVTVNGVPYDSHGRPMSALPSNASLEVAAIPVSDTYRVRIGGSVSGVARLHAAKKLLDLIAAHALAAHCGLTEKHAGIIDIVEQVLAVGLDAHVDAHRFSDRPVRIDIAPVDSIIDDIVAVAMALVPSEGILNAHSIKKPALRESELFKYNTELARAAMTAARGQIRERAQELVSDQFSGNEGAFVGAVMRRRGHGVEIEEIIDDTDTVSALTMAAHRGTPQPSAQPVTKTAQFAPQQQYVAHMAPAPAVPPKTQSAPRTKSNAQAASRAASGASGQSAGPQHPIQITTNASARGASSRIGTPRHAGSPVPPPSAVPPPSGLQPADPSTMADDIAGATTNDENTGNN